MIKKVEIKRRRYIELCRGGFLFASLSPRVFFSTLYLALRGAALGEKRDLASFLQVLKVVNNTSVCRRQMARTAFFLPLLPVNESFELSI